MNLNLTMSYVKRGSRESHTKTRESNKHDQGVKTVGLQEERQLREGPANPWARGQDRPATPSNR